MIYCPYTDQEISEDKANSEHIIPLSLGGTGGLEIDVDKTFNSMLGSELDGALANDFFVALRRTEFGARGHSRKDPWLKVKRATYGDEDRPAQVRIHRQHGLELWDAKDQKSVKGSGTLHIQTNLDMNLPIRFAAKVALAAGYFVYGNKFRSHVDHQQLREIMRIDLASLNQTDTAHKLGEERFTALADDYLSDKPSPKDWRLRCIRAFCDGLQGSVIVLIPSTSRLTVAVGILGKYLAMINVPADTQTLPNEGDREGGHVLAVIDKRLIRCSWAEGLRRYVATHRKK